MSRRRVTKREVEFIRENHGYASVAEIANELGRPERTVYGVIEREGIKKLGERVFAIYKGDDFLFSGNREECIEYMEVSPRTFARRITPSYKKIAEEKGWLSITEVGRFEITKEGS